MTVKEIWQGTFVFYKPVERGARSKATWSEEMIGQGQDCTLFMFDNVANGCADSNALNSRQTGDLQLVLEFGAVPGHNIGLIIFGEFANLLEIDSNGAVLYDIYERNMM